MGRHDKAIEEREERGGQELVLTAKLKLLGTPSYVRTLKAALVV